MKAGGPRGLHPKFRDSLQALGVSPVSPRPVFTRGGAEVRRVGPTRRRHLPVPRGGTTTTPSSDPTRGSGGTAAARPGVPLSPGRGSSG